MIVALISNLAFATAISLPVHVDGEGYLRFVRDGRIVYATAATLDLESGQLASKGLRLTPALRIPAGATRLEVDLAGNVSATIKASHLPCGRLVLARFATKPTEDRGFLVSAARATLGNPGEDTFGVIRSTNAPAEPVVKSVFPSSSSALVVQKVSEVESNTITFGDIASIQADPATKQLLSAIQFAPTPPVGIDMPVTASRIKALAKRAGFEVEIEAPSGAVVRRKFLPVAQEAFTAVAVKAAQESLGSDIALTCADDQGEFRAPMGNLELKSEGVNASGNSLTVTIAVFVDGKRINSRNVCLKADAKAQVKAGANVKILMKSSGITVEVPGVTRTGGMIGQTVTVVVTQTGSILSGVVVGTDKVEVKL